MKPPEILAEGSYLVGNFGTGYGSSHKNIHVYYFEGNFFKPISVPGDLAAPIRRAINQFKKENKLMVKRDRAKPDYKTLVELFHEQFSDDRRRAA